MYIKVKAFPKSKKEIFKKISNNKFEIKIREKAEKNLANKKIIELIAKNFEIRKEDVKIINGHHSPSKLLRINLEKGDIIN